MPARKIHPALNRESRFLYVQDVMYLLNVKSTKAYQIIRQLNKEIEAKGYFKPIAGRVSEKYFRERFYLGDSKIVTQTPAERKGGARNATAAEVRSLAQ